MEEEDDRLIRTHGLGNSRAVNLLSKCESATENELVVVVKMYAKHWNTIRMKTMCHHTACFSDAVSLPPSSSSIVTMRSLTTVLKVSDDHDINPSEVESCLDYHLQLPAAAAHRTACVSTCVRARKRV